MRNVIVFLSAAAVVLLAGVWRLFAAGTAAEQQSLKGVKPIRCAVGRLRPDVTADGLDAARLRASMEARLKVEGLPLSATAANDLCLVVSTSPQRDGMYAVHLHLELRQLVALFHEFIRDPESRTLAPTWSASWIGLLRGEELKRVDEELVKLVDQFIADWRIGNRGRTP